MNVKIVFSPLIDGGLTVDCDAMPATNRVHRHKIVKSSYKCISRNFTDQLWYGSIKSAVRPCSGICVVMSETFQCCQVCVDQFCLKSGKGVRVAHIHSSNTFLSFVTTMSVCRPIVLSSQLGDGCRVPNTQWQLHLIVLSSIVCYWVWSRVHQCSPVCYWVCADRPIVSAELWEGCHRAGHTHSGSTLSTANQPALSVKQTVFWPKIVKNWDNFGHKFGHSLTALSIRQTQFCDKKISFVERTKSISILWQERNDVSLSKTFGTRTDDVSMSNLHWLLW